MWSGICHHILVALNYWLISFLLNGGLFHPDICSVYIESLMSVRTATSFSQIEVLVMVLTAQMTQAHLNTINPHYLAFRRFVLIYVMPISFYT